MRLWRSFLSRSRRNAECISQAATYRTKTSAGLIGAAFCIVICQRIHARSRRPAAHRLGDVILRLGRKIAAPVAPVPVSASQRLRCTARTGVICSRSLFVITAEIRQLLFEIRASERLVVICIVRKPLFIPRQTS